MLSKDAREAKSQILRSPEIDTTDLTISRLEWDDFASTLPIADGVVIEEVSIEDVHCEYLMMADGTENGLVMMFHGGGYVTGSCMTHRDMASNIVKATGYKVLLFDYGLGPEHPFPYAINQSFDLYKSLTHEKIIFMGDSAGAGLAIATMMRIKEENLKQPNKAILISPWVDLTLSGESIKNRYDQEPMLSFGDLVITIHRYLGNENPRNPLASPIFGDLKGLPKTLIHVGDHEILLDDSVRLFDKMQTDQVDVSLKIWPELWHCFQAWDIPEAKEAMNEIAEFMLNE